MTPGAYQLFKTWKFSLFLFEIEQIFSILVA